MNGLPLAVQKSPQYLMGFGRIAGTVTRLGVLIAAPVRVYDHATGALFAETVSGADGGYDVRGMGVDRRYLAVAIDSATPPQNAAAADLITPGPMP